MKKSLWLFLFFIWISPLQAEEGLSSYFYEGNRLYEEGKYEAAVKQYSRIVDEENAPLYYNIGNSYYKLGQKGKAILFYKKALKLNPQDQELQYNLRLVQAQLKDKIIPVKENRFTQTYWRVINRWSQSTWLKFFFILYFLLFFLAVTTLFIRSFRKPLLRTLITTACFALLVSLCLGGKILKEAIPRAIILSLEVQARYGPSEKDVIAFTLHEGTECEILNTESTWAQIRLADDKIAWLPIKDLGFI